MMPVFQREINRVNIKSFSFDFKSPFRNNVKKNKSISEKS